MSSRHLAPLRRVALSCLGLLAALCLLAAPDPALASAPSTITYTGQLLSGNAPVANGLYDFQFSLYTAASGGTQTGTTVSVTSVPVEDGVFYVEINFGTAINTSALYLQTAYTLHGGSTYTTQTPRKLLATSAFTDYAASSGYALTAGGTSRLQGRNISTAAPTDRQVLTWIASTSMWTPATFVNPAGSVTGSMLALPLSLSFSSGGSSSAVLSVTNTASTGYGINSASASGGGINGTSASGDGVDGSSTSGSGIAGTSASGIGVYATSGSNDAGYFKGGGTTGLYGELTDSNGTGVEGVANTGSGAYGVFGGSTSGAGVTGSSSSGKGVYGTSGSGYAGYFKGGGTTGVYGELTVSNGTGVEGVADAGSGAYGVFGGSTSGAGVAGTSSSGYGIYGTSSSNYAGYFAGPVGVTSTLVVGGDLNVTGTKNFQIDHPLHPDTMTLKHACIESNLPENVYNGKVVTDANGDAVVTLPDYFGALNKNPLYQLTVVGKFAQAVVSTEVKDNVFTIKTDKPGVTVCWQVTGERNDAYMKAHPYQAEEQKAEKDQGKYLDPQSYGLPEEIRIGYQKPQASQLKQ